MYSCQGGTFNKKHFPTQWQKARKHLTSGYHYILLQLVSVKVNTGQENHTNQRQKNGTKNWYCCRHWRVFHFLAVLQCVTQFPFCGWCHLCHLRRDSCAVLITGLIAISNSIMSHRALSNTNDNIAITVIIKSSSIPTLLFLLRT